MVKNLNYINLAEGGWTAGNISIMISTFFIIPIILNLVLIYIFSKKLNMIKAEDYKLNFD
mgnify:FL=1